MALVVIKKNEDVDLDEEFGLDEEAFDEHFERFQDWISRSGSLPLFISILYNEKRYNITLSPDNIESLVDYIQGPGIVERIAQLHFGMPIHCLKKFDGIGPTSLNIMTGNADSGWSNFNPDFQFAANLETLEIELGDFLGRLPDSHFPKLTDLKAFFVPMADLVRLIKHSPTLRRCRCKLTTNDPVDSIQNPTVLHHLHHLEINRAWNVGDIAPFFDSFILPALRHLSIDATFGVASSAISLFKRSRCRLDTLTITGHPNWTLTELELLLTSLPERPHLSFSHSFGPTPIAEILQTVLASSTASRIECNAVSSFECFAIWNVTDNWDFIAQLFGPATLIRGTRPMVIKLQLYTSRMDSSTPWMPVEALRVIRELEERGWQWSVGMYGREVETPDFVSVSAKHHQGLTTG